MHEWWPIQFTLVVDEFGVKYFGRKHAEHLQAVIAKYYKMSTDWTGSRYIGIILDWDYEHKKVHLSMPGYVAKALEQYQHHKPSTPQHSPFPCIKYGVKKQSKRSVENFFSSAGQWSLLYCVQSVPSRRNQQSPQSTHWTKPNNFSITSLRKKILSSLTMQWNDTGGTQWR